MAEEIFSCDQCLNVSFVIDAGDDGTTYVDFQMIYDEPNGFYSGETLGGILTIYNNNGIWTLNSEDGSIILAKGTTCDCPYNCVWTTNLNLDVIINDFTVVSCTQTTTTTFYPFTTTTTLQPIPIQPTNECDVITIFPMNVICESTNPTFTNTFDGTASILITGGTPPYEILWDNGGVGPFVTNLGVGEYVATISDYYNDFIITSTCVLTAQTPATTTTTSTTTLPQFGNLCFVISGYFGGAYQSQYINFDFDGYINDNPSWLSDDGEYFIYWNTGSTSQWTVSGYTTGTIFNQNPSTPPITGWQYFGKQNLGISAYEGNCNVVNPITFQIGKNNATCVNDGSIIVNASGGVPPYEYSINGGTSFVTTPIINNLTPGSYVVLVRDSLNNVSTTQNVLISQTITNTIYTLTLNKIGNNINIVVSPTLPIGTSISFDVVYESVFTVAPSPTSASFNGNLNLLLNGSPITPNSPIITNTTTFNSCNNGSYYTTNNKLIWSNVIMINTTTLTGLLTGQIIPNTPLPTCYSANKNVSVTLNNVTISGCQCCSVVITQSTGREITSL
jgi:hypothetical protein